MASTLYKTATDQFGKPIKAYNPEHLYASSNINQVSFFCLPPSSSGERLSTITMRAIGRLKASVIPTFIHQGSNMSSPHFQ